MCFFKTRLFILFFSFSFYNLQARNLLHVLRGVWRFYWWGYQMVGGVGMVRGINILLGLHGM